MHLYYNIYMIQIEVPGRAPLEIRNLVCDVNGTLALDGILIEGVQESIALLKDNLDIYLLTADTHGMAAAHANTLGVNLSILTPGNESQQKARFILQLGADTTAAIGQGANDELMLKAATLGICVFSEEGTATPTLLASDVTVLNGNAALQLFVYPKRLMATLRK